MKRWIFASIALILFFILPFEVKAMSISISGIPSTIDKNQETNIDLFFNCSGCGDSYFRGVFYQSGSDYFGFTDNGSGSWIGNESDKTKYFKIASSDLVEATWSGKIKVKPDSSSSFYNGTGTYYFKLLRYTPSGSTSGVSNESNLQITGATPSPSPSPTPNQTNSPTPTQAPTSAPTSSPTKSPAPTPTKKPTPWPSATPDPNNTDTSDHTGDVLGLRNSLIPTETPASSSKAESNSSFPVIALAFIGSGIGLMGFAGFMAFKKQKENSPDIISK